MYSSTQGQKLKPSGSQKDKSWTWTQVVERLRDKQQSLTFLQKEKIDWSPTRHAGAVKGCLGHQMEAGNATY